MLALSFWTNPSSKNSSAASKVSPRSRGGLRTTNKARTLPSNRTKRQKAAQPTSNCCGSTSKTPRSRPNHSPRTAETLRSKTTTSRASGTSCVRSYFSHKTRAKISPPRVHNKFRKYNLPPRRRLRSCKACPTTPPPCWH